MNARVENIDGHRVVVPIVPSPEVSAASTPPLISTSGEAALPRFAVAADYRTCMVAVLFDPDDIPTLAAHPLFAHEAELLHAAALDCEQEIESQVSRDRDRTILSRSQP